MDYTPYLRPIQIIGASLLLAGVINLVLKILIKKAENTGTRIDDIILLAIYGDIYEIKPRYTKIKNLDNMIITIPNSKVINDNIVNYAAPDTTVRVKIPVGVAYGTDPEKVDKILLEIAHNIPASSS